MTREEFHKQVSELVANGILSMKYLVRNKLLLILGLILFISNVKAQVINFVPYEYQADIKVYFTNCMYDADIVVCKTNFKSKAKSKPGYWYLKRKNNGDNRYSSDRLNVYVVRYKYQSDYSVYISTFTWEIKLTDKYINEVK